MTDISDTSRAHIVHLLEEQKYDEVLPILSDLRETNPSDRESRVYHLLVVRILVLRWNLSRTVTRPAIDSSTMAKRTIKRLASVVRVSESTKLIQSLGQIYQAAETAVFSGTCKWMPLEPDTFTNDLRLSRSNKSNSR